jgi:hypothetical protein
MEKVSRRKALVSLAAAGAGAVVVGAAQAQGPQDTRCEQDPNLSAQKERLRSVLEHVEIANDRLKGAAVRWVNPPDPSRPAFETLLTNINTECQSVMDTTRELLLRRGA